MSWLTPELLREWRKTPVMDQITFILLTLVVTLSVWIAVALVPQLLAKTAAYFGRANLARQEVSLSRPLAGRITALPIKRQWIR